MHASLTFSSALQARPLVAGTFARRVKRHDTTRVAHPLSRGIDDDVGATEGFGWVRRRATTGDATRLETETNVENF